MRVCFRSHVELTVGGSAFRRDRKSPVVPQRTDASIEGVMSPTTVENREKGIGDDENNWRHGRATDQRLAAATTAYDVTLSTRTGRNWRIERARAGGRSSEWASGGRSECACDGGPSASSPGERLLFYRLRNAREIGRPRWHDRHTYREILFAKRAPRRHRPV